MKKICLSFIFTALLLGCVSCANDESKDVKKEMQDGLDLFFSVDKKGRIEKERFFLDGAVLFGMSPSDFTYRRLNYRFSDSHYFSITYCDEFGYGSQKDIFGNSLTRGTPGYVGTVVTFPDNTVELDCEISFSYQGYTVSNTLKVTLYGGSQAVASKDNWYKKDDSHYTYNNSVTYTDDIERPKEKVVSSGSIDLSSMTLNFSIKSDKYSSGLYSYTSYDYTFNYNALSGLVEVSDSASSLETKRNSIYLNTKYNQEKYNNDKNNGWDWRCLRHLMSPLRTFDSLLTQNGNSQYVSVFYSNNYTYEYLFN